MPPVMVWSQRYLSVAMCLVGAVNAGCALINPTVQDEPVDLSQACAPGSPARVELSSPSQNSPESSMGLGDTYSTQALRTAETVGLASLLQQMAKLESGDPESSDRAIQLLILRERVLSRLFLITEEIARVEAEVTCEQGRVQELTDQLQTLQAKHSLIKTLATIIVSGIASITTGAIVLGGSSVAEDVIAIVAGSFAAGLGTLTVLQTAEQKLNHDRNLLREVWKGRGTDDQLLPESVWRLLTMKGDHEDTSLRDQLLGHWSLTLARLGEEAKDKPEGLIYFGRGGIYTLDELRTRSALLRVMNGTLRRVHVKVEFLSREIFTREITENFSHSDARGESVQH